MALESSLRFHGFSLDLDRFSLHGPAGRVELRRKSFDVLRYLVERAGRVVCKEEVMSAVWPDVTVSEESLTQCISEVRRALGDKDHTIIKTVARRGYLIDLPVSIPDEATQPLKLESLDPGMPLKKAQPDAPPSLSEPSSPGTTDGQPRILFRRPRLSMTSLGLALGLILIGVLVWTNLRSAPSTTLTMMAVPTVLIVPFEVPGLGDQRSRVLGIEAEIKAELARALRAFDLIIGAPTIEGAPLAQLGSRYAVTGRAWIDTAGLRVNLQLVETGTNRQLWSESFDFDSGQNGSLSRAAARIARLLVIQIQATESRLPMPANPKAGHYALLGRAIYESERGPDAARKAQALFEKALNLDPNSIPGLHGLAMTKVAQAHSGWIPAELRSSALAEAGDAVDRSIRLDPRNAMSHVIRGSMARALGEIDKAIVSLEYALSLNPNSYAALAELGVAKVDAGRAHEALGHIEQALELAPPEPNIQMLYFYAAYAALHISDDLAAVKWFLRARQANPTYPNTALWLAAAYLGTGDEPAARASLAEYLKEKPRFSIDGFKRFVPMTNPIVAKQRERIMDAWRRLGIPETPPPQQVSN
jgi:DNA-binding winged helix-turn-helix (wHTH) protein/tetratricopeptide (TPR) repeat protein